MHFADRVHVEKIAEALWNPPRGERPGAALMVGAGMSRNGSRPSLANGTLPDWNELTASLIAELRPGAAADEYSRVLRQAGAVSGFLRLAEEYEATHGRAALHQFLLRNVPDDSVSPGELHKAMLELPWQDVFTTNWDTLLERTAAAEPFLGYTTVTRAEQIPRSTPPRVVKLHGSFPNIEPFIFTEEDFRTYPRKFAPFVNMMRQGLMENILVLIGFSGDDPNFLQWAGWVRDELGAAGPQVYLCGWLDLREGQRRLLEKLKVVPVDYCKHPDGRSGKWDAARHANALREFINDLNNLRKDGGNHAIVSRGGEDRFGMHVTGLCQRLSLCQRLLDNSSGENKDEVERKLEDIFDEFLNFIENPTIERNLSLRYLIPRRIFTEYDFFYAENSFMRSSNIKIISNSVSEIHGKGFFDYYFKNKEKARRSDIVKFSYKYICIVHADSSASYLDVDESFYKETERLFGAPPVAKDSHQARHRPGEPPDWYRPMAPDQTDALKDLPFHEVKSRLQEVWLGCLRHYRIASYDEAAKQSPFEAWANALGAFDDHDPKVREAVWYQRCLHGLNSFDLAAVEQALEEWRDADNALIRDPYWAVREAGILAEIGRTEAAIKLATRAFSAMQRQMQPATRDALTSREIWTIVFLLMLTQDEATRDKLERRLAQIVRPEIDPFNLLDKWRTEFLPDIRLGRDVYGEAARGKPEDKTLQNLREAAQVTAQRFSRFLEKIGFPPLAASWSDATRRHVGRDGFAKELMAAGNRLAGDKPGRSLAMCLRACSDGSDVGRITVFATGLLQNHAGLAGEWVDRLIQALPHLMARIGGRSGAEFNFALNRATVAMTALGSLVRHAGDGACNKAFNAALDCHRHAATAAHMALYAPLADLFAALARRAAPAMRQEWVGRMLGAALPGPDGLNPYLASNWPDPFAPFKGIGDWPVDGVNLHHGERAIRNLLDRLAAVEELSEADSGAAKRKRAFRGIITTRLQVLVEAGWVGAEQLPAVARVLATPASAP